MVKLRKNIIKALEGSALGALTFIMIFSAFVITIPAAKAQETPLFSVTLMASTGNPVRRQYSALIANAMQSVGISARVVYLDFTDIESRYFSDPDKVGKVFDDGGMDIGFIGWGFTAPVPDIKSQYLGSKEAFPITGNNYAWYNSSEANALLTQIYTTLDSNVQLQLFRQLSLVLNRDKPYVIVHLTSDIVARDPAIKDYGDPNVFSTMATPFNDLQYFSGVTTYTFAEASDWSSLAPWNTADSNSFYALFVYGVTQGGLQLVDPRTNTMFKAEADMITSSADGRNWTIKIKPGILFHDGVEVTADDYLFTEQAIMTPEVASVGLSDKIGRFGELVSFTYLDGSTKVVDNSGGTLTTPTTVFKSIDKYTYSFAIDPSVPLYAFMNLTETTIAPLPKHYLEQKPFAQWNQDPFATGLKGAYTFTWDTAKYGGTGSYTAYGPFGTGPYVYMGFDPVKRLATLKKFQQYWDKDRLEAKGYYTVDTYNVVTITEKDAAIAAYRTGEINAFDVNYMLASDQDVLTSLGANVFSKPEVGWQEFGFNLNHPVFGTGLGTPVGEADSSQAAEAARHVRQAISYLVPRDLIVKQLLVGSGEAGTTCLKAFGPAYEDPSITPDPYDPNLARAELAAAGYQTGVSPIVPAPPSPDLLYGYNDIEGTFRNPLTNEPYANYVVKILVSQDNITWTETPIAPVTDADGTYHAMVLLEWPTTYVKAIFTGYDVPAGEFPGVQSGTYYDDLVKAGEIKQLLPPLEGPVQTYTLRTMKSIIDELSTTVATKNDVSALSTQVTSLTNSVNALTSYLYASIAVAIISLIVAAIALVHKRGT